MPVIGSAEIFMRLRGTPRVPHSVARNEDVDITIDYRILLTRQQQQKLNKPPSHLATKRQATGWKLSGTVVSDHFTWCHEFEGSHPKWGEVRLRDNRMVVSSRI